MSALFSTNWYTAPASGIISRTVRESIMRRKSFLVRIESPLDEEGVMLLLSIESSIGL
jgi:hypothetical protein